MTGMIDKSEPTYQEAESNIQSDGKAKAKATTNRNSSKNKGRLGLEGKSLDIVTELLKETEKTKKEVDVLKKDLTESKIKTIETLAIFVALFTFVSVDIQIFKSAISILSALGFVLVMLAGLMIFVITLAYLMGDERFNSWKCFGILVFLLAIGAVGVYCIGHDYLGVEKTLKEKFYIKEQLYTKEEINTFINASSTNELDLLKKCVVKFGFTYKCFNK